jgi:hypothetical protein
MNEEERAAIRARMKAITPGEWHIPSHRRFPEFGYDVATNHPRTDLHGDRGLMLRTQADAAFIAHAPADIRALLAENTALRAVLRELVTWIEGVQFVSSELAAILDSADTVLNNGEADR